MVVCILPRNIFFPELETMQISSYINCRDFAVIFPIFTKVCRVFHRFLPWFSTVPNHRPLLQWETVTNMLTICSVEQKYWNTWLPPWLWHGHNFTGLLLAFLSTALSTHAVCRVFPLNVPSSLFRIYHSTNSSTFTLKPSTHPNLPVFCHSVKKSGFLFQNVLFLDMQCTSWVVTICFSVQSKGMRPPGKLVFHIICTIQYRRTSKLLKK